MGEKNEMSAAPKTPEEIALAMPLSGKSPIVSFRVRRDFERLPEDLVSQFENFFVPDVSDKVGRLYTMDGSIRPLFTPGLKICGSAVTVKVPAGDNMGVKQALQYIKPGDVLIVDAQGFTDWCLGGFHMLVMPIRKRGLKGLIVNGAYRDLSQAKEAGFPIYGKAVAPYSGPKRGPAEINVPVCCGGVIVHPGDIVLADGDGVVIVPRDYAAQVAKVLSQGPGAEHPDDMRDDELTAKEQRRVKYFEETFREKGGVYLD